MAPGVSDRIVRISAEDVEQLMRAVALIITKLSESPNYSRYTNTSVSYAAAGYGAGMGGRAGGRGAGGPPGVDQQVCLPACDAQWTPCVRARCGWHAPLRPTWNLHLESVL